MHTLSLCTLDNVPLGPHDSIPRQAGANSRIPGCGRTMLPGPRSWSWGAGLGAVAVAVAVAAQGVLHPGVTPAGIWGFRRGRPRAGRAGAEAPAAGQRAARPGAGPSSLGANQRAAPRPRPAPRPAPPRPSGSPAAEAGPGRRRGGAEPRGILESAEAGTPGGRLHFLLPAAPSPAPEPPAPPPRREDAGHVRAGQVLPEVVPRAGRDGALHGPQGRQGGCPPRPASPRPPRAAPPRGRRPVPGRRRVPRGAWPPAPAAAPRQSGRARCPARGGMAGSPQEAAAQPPLRTASRVSALARPRAGAPRALRPAPSSPPPGGPAPRAAHAAESRSAPGALGLRRGGGANCRSRSSPRVPPTGSLLAEAQRPVRRERVALCPGHRPAGAEAESGGLGGEDWKIPNLWVGHSCVLAVCKVCSHRGRGEGPGVLRGAGYGAGTWCRVPGTHPREKLAPHATRLLQKVLQGLPPARVLS